MDREFLHKMLILGAGIIVVLPFFRHVMWEKAKRRLLPISVLFDGQMGELKGVSDWTLRGRFKHRPVTITVRSVGYSGSRSVRVEMLCSAAMRFMITRGGLADPVRRALGVLRTLEVGDAYLDKEYRFRASAPDRFGPWVQQMDTRRRVEALFDDGEMEFVRLKGGTLSCGYTAPRFDMSVADARLILEALEGLAESLEAGHQDRWVLES